MEVWLRPTSFPSPNHEREYRLISEAMVARRLCLRVGVGVGLRGHGRSISLRQTARQRRYGRQRLRLPVWQAAIRLLLDAHGEGSRNKSGGARLGKQEAVVESTRM